LADLIRPALAWREGSSLPKPPGAFAGGGFIVVNTMTSLTGASGEDFASILGSLGYRVERRPKPAEPAPPPAAANEAATPAGATPQDASSLDAAPQEIEETAIADAEGILPPHDSLIDAPAPSIAEPDGASAPELLDEAAAANGQAAEVSAPAEGTAEPARETGESTSSEPILIEVWRPGRAEGRRRPNFRRRGPSKDAAPAPTASEGPVPAAPDVAAVSAPQDVPAEPASDAPRREGRRFRQRRRDAPERADRPRRERAPAHAARHERPERKDRYERREKAPDPNSPFAKLAALKAQLEADAKERR
jgi:ATP-dependent RNA helicase SUPV3L1/SUV3